DASQCSLGAGSHVQRLNGQPHCVDADHFSSSRIHAAHSVAADAGHVIATDVVPRRSSMRMSAAATGVDGASGSAMNRSMLGAGVAASSQGLARRRHLCTRLAFRPCASATLATDAPGAAHSASTRAFRSAPWRRREEGLESCMVSTRVVGGHHACRRQRRSQDGIAGRILFNDVKARHGRLDTVILNAVKDEHAPLGKITEAQFDQMVGINLKGVLFSIQSAMPLMRGDGSIVLIGSTASVAPPAGMSIYGAIKAGFHGMVRALIQDAKGTGVRINILSPGAVDTPSLRRALGKAGGLEKADAVVKSIAQRSPLGRIGKTSEIGKVAAFLASDASSYVNGVELFVDGGLTQV